MVPNQRFIPTYMHYAPIIYASSHHINRRSTPDYNNQKNRYQDLHNIRERASTVGGQLIKVREYSQLSTKFSYLFGAIYSVVWTHANARGWTDRNRASRDIANVNFGTTVPRNACQTSQCDGWMVAFFFCLWFSILHRLPNQINHLCWCNAIAIYRTLIYDTF